VDQLLIISAVLLCIAIETIRIKVMHGKVVNISKKITRRIAAGLFVVIVLVCQPWKDVEHWWIAIPLITVFAIAYAGCRGTLYDPLLNVLALKRKLWQDSTTTNSRHDQEEQRRKINTYQQRALYAGIWLVFAAIYELSKIMF
jgi:hypothetical protein